MTGAAHYRLYLIDDTDRFCGVEEFNAADDTAALATARLSLGRTQFPAAEVWQLARRVGTIRQDGPAQEGQDQSVAGG